MPKFRAKLTLWVDNKEVDSTEYESDKFSELIALLFKYLREMGPY